MKKFISKIKAHRWLQILLVVLLVGILSITVYQNSVASNSAKEKKRSVIMELGGEYDMYIGRAGVYFGNSQMEGTLVISRQEHPSNKGGTVWMQQMLTVRAYEGEEGVNQYSRPKGLGYVYFNMDILERRDWDDYGNGRMSIWYFHDYYNRWVECPTTLRREISAPRGRLTCYLEEFGQYGLGLKKESLTVKMTKQGIIELTTSSTPSVTPSVTPSPIP